MNTIGVQPTGGAGLAVGFGTPFEAQIDFLKNKLRLPTERWDDIQRSAHDRAFMVAGAAQADLLHDLHQEVVTAAQQGEGVQAFTKRFRTVVAQHGWTGWTGEGTPEGEAWRARVIYQTNMATSYAAGRYRQMTDPAYVRLRPFWRYLHSDTVMHPRPLHQSWHGLTLRHDHPFWQSHFPPNGWGCQCRVASVSQAEGEASAQAGLGTPPANWRTTDARSGAPLGIDKGFDYAPGAGVDVPLRTMVQNKLITYPPAIGKALAADVNRYINSTQSAADFVAQVLENGLRRDQLWVGFVETPQALSRATQVDTTGYFVVIPADAPRHVQASHGTDGKGQRPAMPADFEHIGSVLNEADQLKAGSPSRHGHETVVASKRIGDEVYRAVFEVLPGKKNRALALLSLVIKTGK